MTRETRIALLVGMAFIVLFGLVLGERSLRISRRPRPHRPPPPQVQPQPGPEVVTAARQRNDDRPVLSPRPAPRPAAPAGPAVTADQQAAASRRPPSNVRPAEGSGGPPSRTQRVVSSQPPPPPPPPLAARTHTIRKGDTLWSLARLYLGDPKRWKEIFQANRDRLRDASTLSPGQELVIPPLEQAPQLATPAVPGRRVRARYTEVTLGALARRFGAGQGYTVRSGDSLTGIARRVMGDDSRRTVWKLFEANRDRIRDPDELPVGLRLQIPS